METTISPGSRPISSPTEPSATEAMTPPDDSATMLLPRRRDLADDLQDAIDNLRNAHLGGIHIDGVGGLGEGRRGAMAVDVVATLEFGADHLIVRVLAPGEVLPMAALGSFLEGGVRTLTLASGSTAVPMSRPTITTPPRRPRRRCSSRRAARTPA